MANGPHCIASRPLVFRHTPLGDILLPGLLLRTVGCGPHLVEISYKPGMDMQGVNLALNIRPYCFQLWGIDWQMRTRLFVAHWPKAKHVGQTLSLLPWLRRERERCDMYIYIYITINMKYVDIGKKCIYTYLCILTAGRLQYIYIHWVVSKRDL